MLDRVVRALNRVPRVVYLAALVAAGGYLVVVLGSRFINDHEGFVLVALLAFWAIGFYFLPSLIAVTRKMPNLGGVVIVNTLIGWTLIGWPIALVRPAPKSAVPPDACHNLK